MKIEGLVRTFIFNQNCTIEGGQAVEDRSIRVGANAHVAGAITAGDVTNSFNTIGTLKDDNPLKDMLTALAKAVEAAVPMLPKEQGETLASDLKGMVEEATKGARKGMLRALGEQIKHVAVGVKDAAVAAALTGSLSPLLAHFGITL